MKYDAPKHEIRDYGFDPSKVEIKSDNYLLGTLPFKVIKEDGNFTNYLPKYEPQAENYETYGCTVWGGQNQIETLHKFLFKVEPNYNEIFNYILGKISPPGANPHDIYETFRKQGLIDQALIPMPPTYEEFRNTPITLELIEEGKKWLTQYDFKHEWITDTSKENLIYLLKGGPISLGVTAWYEKDGVYIDRGLRNTHWCEGFAPAMYKDRPTVDIFDTYDHSIKRLHPDHNISVAKRITLEKKEPMVEAYKKGEYWWLSILRSLFNSYK